MTGKQWAILISTTVTAGAGVFLAAGADGTWPDMAQPQYIFGSIVAMASAITAFFSKSPEIGAWRRSS